MSFTEAETIAVLGALEQMETRAGDVAEWPKEVCGVLADVQPFLFGLILALSRARH
jgi:hypothetical protein